MRLYMALAGFFETAENPTTTTLFQIDLVNFLFQAQETASKEFKNVLQ